MNWMKELDKRKAYENLSNAIIEQAANDFREAKRRLQKNARDAEAEKTYRETKRFFRSEWFSQLTTLDGELLLEKLEEESE
mgnify:FL=1